MKDTTKTTLVMEALARANDFMSLDQVAAVIPQTDRHTLQESLRYLKTRKAVDCLEGEGHLWWFPTPDTDNRLVTHDERSSEKRPRAKKPVPFKRRAKQMKW